MKNPRTLMMQIFAESKNYIVLGEYEAVTLQFTSRKNRNREVVVGDFYGNLQAAAISEDESFCAMVGCGLIVYYLKEPFNDYIYETETGQWKEFFREYDDVMWIKAVEILDNSTLLLTTAEEEGANKYRFDIESFDLVKLS
jgi:hypothetical protein